MLSPLLAFRPPKPNPCCRPLADAAQATVYSEVDDVNIARFHPCPGFGFVYGTKQVRTLDSLANRVRALRVRALR